MAIPKYDEIMPEALLYLSRHGVQTGRSLEAPLAEIFGLTEEESSQEYASGNGLIFLDRISWALSHLTIARLLVRPKRGSYQCTDLAQQYLNDPKKLRAYVKKKAAERHAANRASKSEAQAGEKRDFDEVPPQELMNRAFISIQNSVCEEILDTILSKSPYEFERLVLKLLDRMGYGGQLKDAGTVTQASNDGGIDGIIKEDILGLGKIHIQAKRYKRDSGISREEIQKFVGALAVAQSNKGVFITTSHYSKGAIEYVDNLNGATNVVLIDGATLAKYIYDFSLGMQTEQVVEIKKMDTDFWDDMLDEQKSEASNL